MRTKLLFPFLLIAWIVSCEREISPEQADRFMKFYGSFQMDVAQDVEPLDDGGYAICGTGMVGDQGTQMMLIVTDAYGNMKNGYPKYFTEEGLSSGANALVAIRGGQGGFLLAGYVERPLEENPELNQKDIFLVKASPSGQVSWQRSYGSAEDEVVLHAIPRIGPGFMLAGYQVENGNSDIMIMGVEEEGDSTKLGLLYNNPFAKNGRASYLFNSGDRYLCVCTYDKIGEEGTDIIVLNFDDNLSPFPKNLTDDASEYGTCIIENGTDQYLVLGNRVDANGSVDMVVHQIQTNGLLITSSVLLATIPGGNYDLIGSRFVRTSDGRIAIVGTRRLSQSEDMVLQFLTSDYSTSGQVVFGSAGEQTGADIDMPSGGGLVLLGTGTYENNSMISMIRTTETGDL